jgi:hypothetical protein
MYIIYIYSVLYHIRSVYHSIMFLHTIAYLSHCYIFLVCIIVCIYIRNVIAYHCISITLYCSRIRATQYSRYTYIDMVSRFEPSNAPTVNSFWMLLVFESCSLLVYCCSYPESWM